MTRFLIVCGAGGLGCGARYLVSLWAGGRWGGGFPWGTLLVNLIGSFLITLVIELSVRTTGISPHLRLALTTGFLGGFTTYSSFNHESTSLLLDGHVGRGLVNLGAMLGGCLVAGLLALALARRLAW
ncbi:MAG: CrcB family protein [Kofleriaceae bacterium]|nr:CrcB family protein [Kofleriaceae bacterium]MCL4225670.1 CrcB family protein [Myxococcales bacterium]